MEYTINNVLFCFYLDIGNKNNQSVSLGIVPLFLVRGQD